MVNLLMRRILIPVEEKKESLRYLIEESTEESRKSHADEFMELFRIVLKETDEVKVADERDVDTLETLASRLSRRQNS